MIHCDDVAKVHVLALNPKVEGNQNFVIMSGGVEGKPLSDSVHIFKKQFPEAVRLPVSGSQPTKRLGFYTSRTKKALGI